MYCRFENTLASTLFGHMHTDQFRVYYEDFDSTKRPTNVAYLSPSFTTSKYRIPTYRIYTYDGPRDGATWVHT